MIENTLVDPKQSALLVIDIQNDYCSKNGKVSKLSKLDVSPIQNFIPQLEKFISISKKVNVPVVFTKMVGDPNYMAKNAALKRGKTSYCTPNTAGSEYYIVKPNSSDIEIDKYSYDAFSNPKLNQFLTKNDIKNIIITGVNTSICVDSTVRSAFTLGYNIVVPKDLVGAPTERLHQHHATIEVWDFVFAHITKSEEIIKVWNTLKI